MNGLLKPIDQVSPDDLKNLKIHAQEISRKAMELTDSWGAMFVMDKDSLENVARAIGLSEDLVPLLHENFKALQYVKLESGSKKGSHIFTWHGPDTAILALRGSVDFDNLMAVVNQDNLRVYLENNANTFRKVLASLPEYTEGHMFSPSTASKVFSSFGMKLEPEFIWDLALNMNANATEDAEGRRGISAQFIRGITLTLTSCI